MGRSKKIVEVELGKEEQLPEKPNIPSLSGKYFASFSGDTHNHAIQDAWAWVASVKADKNLSYNVSMVDYYHQKAFGGRGIIVSYNKVDR